MAQRLEEYQFLYKQEQTSTLVGLEFLQIGWVRAMQKQKFTNPIQLPTT